VAEVDRVAAAGEDGLAGRRELRDEELLFGPTLDGFRGIEGGVALLGSRGVVGATARIDGAIIVFALLDVEALDAAAVDLADVLARAFGADGAGDQRQVQGQGDDQGEGDDHAAGEPGREQHRDLRNHDATGSPEATSQR